tara:strand:- start:238 stop:948 length:711 start_codon:yes stop_codon:yes gene_type:complete
MTLFKQEDGESYFDMGIPAKVEGYKRISWHNKYRGRDVVLCGTGPSLWKVNAKKLKARGKLIFGLNNSFELLDLDLWMICDPPCEFDAKIWQCDTIKFCNKKHSDEILSHNPPNTFFYKSYKDVLPTMIGPNGRPISGLSGPYINFKFGGTTFSVVVQMIRWLGFKRVFLVGCDFGGDSKLSKLSPDYRDKDQQQHLIDGVALLRSESRKGGVEYISCTAGSPINEFLPYKSIGRI